MGPPGGAGDRVLGCIRTLFPSPLPIPLPLLSLFCVLFLNIILSRNHRFACFLEAFWAAEDLSVSPRSLHFAQEVNTLKRRPKIKALAGTAHAQPSIFLLLPRLVRHAAISP